MSETSFASLNPSLLARKGGAKPAMRRQMGAVPGFSIAGNVAENLEDLGWNDMGDDHHSHECETVHLTPAPANEQTADEAAANDAEAQAELSGSDAKPPVRKQQEAIAEQLIEPKRAQPQVKAVAAATKAANDISKPAAKDGKRAAFTLRLDAERHLKLRLASTIRNRSAQALVTEALDALLADMEDLDSLAAQVKKC